jgi:tetratricopeptide (TPR) repeat protein
MSAESYFQHPLYGLAMHHFQEGNWRAGLKEVERLIQLYPLEQELRSLRQEINFKERLDNFEIGDRAVEGRRRIRKLVLRMGAATVIAIAAYIALSTYSEWMGQQVIAARARVEREIQFATVTAMQRDVEALMYAGRLAEAKSVADEIALLDPSFPGLTELSAELTAALELSNQYDDAMQRIDRGDWLGAQSVLQQLAAVVPNYRDINIQLTYIDRRTMLDNLLSAGEASFARGDWEEAVTAFETMRTVHPQYEPEVIEARLFDSYVNAARSVLIGQADSLAALEVAEAHFRKALALRPQNPMIKQERELAGLYLKAQEDFDQGQWSEVITALDLVIAADAGYAQGTARQTLYDAYVARGEFQISVHLFEAALSDYERAAALAEQDSGAVLRLFEAQLKVGEAQGANGNYEAAVLHYRAAADLGNLRARGAEDNPAMLSALQEAESYAANGNFSVAYERYQRAVRLADANQVKKVHIVQEGEYLTLLASRYGSTVRAIALANGIANDNLIFPGQELLIPVLP